MIILYDHEQAGDIIQPFVKIRVLGHPCDAQSWQSNAVSGTLILVMIKDHWSSKIIDQYTVHCHHDHGQVPNNGFNPTWSEEASFNIRVPELAIIEFKVLDIIEPKAMVGKKKYFSWRAKGRQLEVPRIILDLSSLPFPSSGKDTGTSPSRSRQIIMMVIDLTKLPRRGNIGNCDVCGGNDEEAQGHYGVLNVDSKNWRPHLLTDNSFQNYEGRRLTPANLFVHFAFREQPLSLESPR